MPKGRHVIDVIEGEWLPWAHKEQWVCCDCSLVHEVERRTRKGHVELRMFRNNRSTAAYRRGQNGNHRNTRKRNSQ